MVPTRVDFDRLLDGADAFRSRLDAARRHAGPVDFRWYPYDSLTNLWTLDRLLVGPDRDLLTLTGGKPVLDIGCADGDMALYLESHGFEVDVLDNPASNANAMRGVRELAQQLGSGIGIYETDLDQELAWPEKRYGLILFLGVLYHLKNPFRILEALAKRCDFCLVSTKLTEYVPGIFENVSASAVSYLADVYEWNQDTTNFWAFSDIGFRRLLARCNFDVRGYLLLNESAPGNSTGAVGAQRAFCLLASRFATLPFRMLLGPGWYPREAEGWRWTSKQFAVRIEQDAFRRADALVLSSFIPESMWNKLQAPPTLTPWVNGKPAAAHRFSQPGASRVRIDLQPFKESGADLRIDCRIDSSGDLEADDARELGIVVSTAEIESDGAGYAVL